MNRYRAYGLEIASERPLPLRPSSAPDAPGLDIRHAGVSPPLPPSGPDRRSLARSDAGWTLRYDNQAGGWMAFDYDASCRRLVVSGSVEWEDCAGPLCGVVCGVLLGLGGATLLHAACLDIGGAAIAILGASGQGKSTLAAALAARGALLVSEDLLVLRAGPDGHMAEPGPPTLHLLPDAWRALGSRQEVVRTNAEGKLRLALPYRGTESVPLRALFVLRPGGDRPAALERLAGPKALAALSENLYGSGWIRPLDGADLQFCARLARDVAVFGVSRPWSLAALDETVTLLEAGARSAM